MEKVYEFSKEDTKNIEKLVDDNNLVINHMVLPQGAGLVKNLDDEILEFFVVKAPNPKNFKEE